MSVQIRRFDNTVFNSNSYIVTHCRHAVIIDVGDFNQIDEYIKEKGLSVLAVLITHTHYDHIYGIREFMSRYPDVPIYTSENGKQAFLKPNWNFSRYHNDPIIIDSERIKILENGDKISFPEGTLITAIATPGHDFSCLSYVIGDNLFTGDSYIPGVKVVASFPKSDRKLAAYWYARLEEMANEHNIYPGHGIPKIKTMPIEYVNLSGTFLH